MIDRLCFVCDRTLTADEQADRDRTGCGLHCATTED